MAPSEHEAQLSPASLPLPKNADSNASKKPTGTVWPTINAPEHSPDLPLASPSAKCVNTTHPDGVCCRDLLQEERTLIDPDIVRDV